MPLHISRLSRLVHSRVRAANRNYVSWQQNLHPKNTTFPHKNLSLRLRVARVESAI
jgi:hypothetical protein